MIEKILVMVVVYLLIGYARLIQHTRSERKESILYSTLVLISFYLSFIFITNSTAFNLDDLFDFLFGPSARAVLAYFTSP
ncbi:hypothetical protein [Pseudalkalibacillus hwajinpoensis]|uniref:Uncharacterized protein n=1 Tax=Guptibacillus hwajinpoensis TaxID=208199 RepID=A0A4V5PZ13_9BACL|nr:hypothetical protein [Pseudalkalibacillus hwajinpoensis]TKD72258.1 hypothetical protein FBF83_05570 [Pseudalkalibacillus hwajinpoensis]